MLEKVKIAVMIPARNEENNIEETIDNLLNMNNLSTRYQLEIVVVDDGSKDKTIEKLKNYPIDIVEREDRGYSALGRPELAETHNSGFRFISQNLQNIQYLMVVGADTTFEINYIDILLDEFEKNEKLVMSAGIINNTNASKNAVRGSGRIIKYNFWIEFGELLPTKYYAWESYPIYYALAKGYHTLTFNKAIMYTKREPMAIVDWKNYGIQMREIGYIFPYVIHRGIKQILKFKFMRFIKLVYGYVKTPENVYPNNLRTYVRGRQYLKIKRLLYFNRNHM